MFFILYRKQKPVLSSDVKAKHWIPCKANMDVMFFSKSPSRSPHISQGISRSTSTAFHQWQCWYYIRASLRDNKQAWNFQPQILKGDGTRVSIAIFGLILLYTGNLMKYEKSTRTLMLTQSTAWMSLLTMSCNIRGRETFFCLFKLFANLQRHYWT